MRYFNTHGPVNASTHFVVPRTALVNHLVEEIDAGHYFTIYAPRQMGKTTLLYSLVDRLAARFSHPIRKASAAGNHGRVETRDTRVKRTRDRLGVFFENRQGGAEPG